MACREDAFVFNDTCRSCEPGFAPDTVKTRCIKLAAEVIPWTSPWAIVPLTFASVGILSTLFTTAVFIRFNRTPVIMASGRELCYVLLVGILSCYGMSFVILSKPTTWNCTYLRIGLGLCLSICYSAILTKTNRISRIFNQGMKSIKRPSYTSPKSQVAIAIGEFRTKQNFRLHGVTELPSYRVAESPSYRVPAYFEVVNGSMRGTPSN